MDLVVANFGFDSVSIFLGYGNSSFASQITHSMGIGSAPRMVAVGHFNNDTRLDIMVANFGMNSIVILFGNGNGSFAHQTTIETSPSHPSYVTVDDLNDDGYLDLAFAGNGTDHIGIVLGFENGTFRTPIYFSTAYDSRPCSIVVGDFDGDNRKDIAVANYGTDNIGIFLGYGNGTFTNQTTFSTGSNSGPYSIAIFDLNNDSHLDLAVVYADVNKIAVFIGYGNGSFAKSRLYSTGRNSIPIFIVVADFNNDNKGDITLVNNRGNTVMLLIGHGDGTFDNPVNYSTDPLSSPSSIGVGDFNSDNQLDVAIANRENNNIKIFNSYSKQTFGNQIIFPTDDRSLLSSTSFTSTDVSSDPTFLTTDNLGNDNQQDIVIANGSRPISIPTDKFNGNDRLDTTASEGKIDNVAILSRRNNKNFRSIIRSSGIPLCTKLVAVGDFNRDGQLDLAVVNFDTDSVGILLGYDNGSFAGPLLLSTGDASSPIAVAVEDFNNDGLPDVAVANYGTSSIGVFLGYGNGLFAPDVTYYTDDSYDSIVLAIGDANNDGRLDIFFAKYYSGSIGILLGYGDGTFSSQTISEFHWNTYPTSIAVADFNNDGRLDIAVVNSISESVGILLGWGNGTFQNQIIFSTGGFSKPISLAVGDFNSDGNMDIVVSSRPHEEEHILILLGNGHGNFSFHGKYTTGIYSDPCSVVVGQFSNNKQLDIAVSNLGTHQVGIFLGYGDGTFTSQTTYSMEPMYNPAWIEFGDFNNDNLTDLAVADHWMSTVGIFLAFIDTSFVDSTTYFTGSAALPTSIVLGHFTNDGQLNIVVGNYGTHDIVILNYSGNGKFSMQITYTGDSTFYPSCIIASDFNNDKQLDIAVANSVTDTITVLYGERNRTFDKSTVFSTGANTNPQSIAAGDFNDDNRMDIVVAHSGSGSIGLLLKIDIGAVKSFGTLSVGFGSKPHRSAVGDFDNDGRLDIAVTNNGNANIGIFFGLGDGTFSEQQTIYLGNGIFPIWISCGDFNNDKQLDMVVSSNLGSTPVIVLLGNGDRSFRIETNNEFDLTEVNAVGDFNSDGLLDVALCFHAYYGAVKVFLGYGNGTFEFPETYAGFGWSPVAMTVDDLNKDGRLDIVVVYVGDLNIAIYFGNGDGTFTGDATYSTADYGTPFSVTTGDFNNDTWVDIAIGMYQANTIGVFFGSGNGSFSPLTPYLTRDVSLHKSISAADFNNDGRLDIIITETTNDKLGIILGHVNNTFFDEITYFTGNGSYPHSIGLGDFNNDGRLDIAVSNMLSDNIGIFVGYASEDFVGTAAESIGNSSKPVSIAVEDFNNDTCLDVVVADRGTNQIVIVQGSGYGTFLGQQTYSTGAGSYPNWVAVEDFNQDQYLDIAVVNSGTNTIGIFLGYGNGTFSSLITSSPDNIHLPVSFSVGHFDNDTYLDIALASFGNNNVCILFGNGNGSFGNAVCRTPGYDSHPSAVVAGDVNGDNMTDVVIANKGSSTIEILTKFC